MSPKRSNGRDARKRSDDALAVAARELQERGYDAAALRDIADAMAVPAKETARRSGSRRTRKDDLVAIAARLFHERGYDATSMQDIADSMGILKGSVYHHVATKEDILWMIVEAPLGELLEEVRAILNDASLTTIERIRRAITVHCTSFERNYPHMSVITREYGESLSPKMRDQIAGMRDQYYLLWKKAIAAGKRSGELRSDLDTGIAVEAILGMINWMFRWYKPGGRLSAAKVADEFSALLERGLLASPA